MKSTITLEHNVCIIAPARTSLEQAFKSLFKDYKKETFVPFSVPNVPENLDANYWDNFKLFIVSEELFQQKSPESIFHRLKLKRPDAPIVVITTAKEPDYIKLGAFGTISPPICRRAEKEIFDLLNDLQQQDNDIRFVASLACEHLRASLCIIWGLDAKRETFRVIGWNGPLDAEFRKKISLDFRSEATRDLFRTGEPLKLSDVTNEKTTPYYRDRQEAEKRGWRSLLTCPMKHKGRVIGLMDVYWMQIDRDEKELQRRLVKVLAHQATAPEYNRRLSEQFKALAELNARLSRPYGVENHMGEILKDFLPLIGASRCRFYKYDISKKRLKIIYCSAGIEKIATDEREISVRIADFGSKSSFTELSSTHKEIIAPAKKGDALHGLLMVEYDHNNAFDTDDVDLLGAFAGYAGIALERGKITRHLQQVGRYGLSQDLKTLLDYVAGAVQDLTGMDVALWTVHSGAKQLRIAAHRGLREAHFQNATTPMEGSITGEALKAGEILWSPNVQKDERFYNTSEAKNQNWKFFICVPLLGRQRQPLGSLSLYSKEERNDLDPELKEMINRFATQVSIALFRRMLLNQIMHISDLAASAVPEGLTTVLQEIAKGAAEMFAADYIAVYPIHVDLQEFDTENIIFYGVDAKVEKVRPSEDGLSSMIISQGGISVLGLDQEEEPNIVGIEDLTSFRDDKKNQIINLCNRSNFINNFKVSSFIGLPIKSGGIVQSGKIDHVGILYIDYKKSTRFSSEDYYLMRVFARQVGQAIQSAYRLKNRAQDLNALKDIHGSLLAKDTDSIFQSIVEKAYDLTMADYVALRLSDESKQTLELKAFKGRKPKLESLPLTEDTFAGSVFLKKEGAYCRDVRNTEDCRHYLEWSTDIRSCMAAPIRKEQDVIGTIYVESVKENAYSEQYQLDFLVALADHAGIALGIDARRAKEIDTLRKINEAIIAGDTKEVIAADEDKILDLIVREALSILPGEHASLWLLDENGNLHLRAVSGKAEEKAWSYDHIYRSSKSINMVALETQEPIIQALVNEDSFFRIYDEAKASITSCLVFRNQLIGTLNVESAKENAFSQYRHSNLMRNFCAQASVAIRMGRLVRLLDSNRQSILKMIEKVIVAIKDYSDVNTVIQKIAESVVSFMPWLDEGSTCEVRMYSEKEKVLISKYCEGGEIDEKYKILSIEEGATGRAFRKKKTQYIPDVSKDDDYIPFMKGKKSELAIPMYDGDSYIGVLNIEHPRINPFTEEEIQLAETIADFSAVVISGAKRKIEFEQKTKEWDVFKEFTTSIFK